MGDRSRYLYATLALDRLGEVEGDDLATLTDRQRLRLHPRLAVDGGSMSLLHTPARPGIVIESLGGVPRFAALRLAASWLRSGARAFLYWPGEGLVEALDPPRIRTYWKLVFLAAVFHRGLPFLRLLRTVRSWVPPSGPAALHGEGLSRANWLRVATSGLDAILRNPHPARVRSLVREGGRLAVRGPVAYLRTDYWVCISSGGSYGHTCHVAHQLALASQGITCFMGQRYAMIDRMGHRQVIVGPPYEDSSEQALLVANVHYHARLRAALEAQPPALLYERLVLGTFVGAQLSRELRIPYILEYNGSEISMNRSFGSGGYRHEDVLTRAEEAAFAQATVISVISQPVKEGLLARGVPQRKILVNPNGVDTDMYAPADPEERRTIRESLGFAATDRVVGFIGTFGGWHGIGVLAAALAPVCEREPDARFLLIGDGVNRFLVDEAIARGRLWDRVLCTGNVPQEEGAHLLKACDIFVSPHDSHMVDSRFFGSPTKLFEYMGLGRGIVASDLEQIGEVLSPALRPADLANPRLKVALERAVLCRPGDVREFVDAVCGLCRNQAVAEALGENARRAAEAEFSWGQHVQRLLAFIAAEGADRQDKADPRSLEEVLEEEHRRYTQDAPWMPDALEFEAHAGERVLQIRAGAGMDLAQYAKYGAIVTGLDAEMHELAVAKDDFAMRGLSGSFVCHEGPDLPFPDSTFDVVYAGNVICHARDDRAVVSEIRRVLRPGGLAIVIAHAEESLRFWLDIVALKGLAQLRLRARSLGDLLSEVAKEDTGRSGPLTRTHTRQRLGELFEGFEGVVIVKRGLAVRQVPAPISWLSSERLERAMGWYLVLKARRPLDRRE